MPSELALMWKWGRAAKSFEVVSVSSQAMHALPICICLNPWLGGGYQRCLDTMRWLHNIITIEKTEP